MRYYKLLFDGQNDNLVLRCENLYGLKKNSLTTGKKLEDWDDRISFICDPRSGHIITDYIANNVGWFIASNPMLQLLQKLSCTFEAKEIKVKEISYFIINLLDVLEALSLEHSEYSTYQVGNAKVNSIRKYALKKDKIINNNVFKLLGDEGHIFVSDFFVEEVKAKELLGCDFLEVTLV